jgi:ubiquinone/menaquinone biosynthesis C-methylase UbiE
VWKRAIDSTARVIGLELKHAQRRYFETLVSEVRPRCRWLDLGCGHQIVPPWAATDAEQRALVVRSSLFVGADLDLAIRDHPYIQHRVFARGEQSPFASGSFDLVTANMVMEHLEHPEGTFAELLRILSPGGRLVFHTPNLRYPYIYVASQTSDAFKKVVIRVLERRSEQDVFPTHYRVNTTETIQALAEKVGFQLDRVEINGSVGSFNLMGPLGLLELPLLKLLSLDRFRRYSATIIAVLCKQA